MAEVELNTIHRDKLDESSTNKINKFGLIIFLIIEYYKSQKIEYLKFLLKEI